MSSPVHETNTEELRALMARDLAASNELADRISQLRIDIAEGKPMPSKKVDLMERSNKDMTKDLVNRVEKIESASELDATDREMLQALNARLAVCDLQAMRLAELREVEFSARSTKQKGAPEPAAESDASAAEHNAGEHTTHVADEDEAASEYESDTGSEYSDEPEIDKSDWPLLYRIMDVDPDTLNRDIEPMLEK
jgi:hypothetical protein